MAGLMDKGSDESNAAEQCIDLGDCEEPKLVCENCSLIFSIHDQEEGGLCPECEDGDLVTVCM